MRRPGSIAMVVHDNDATAGPQVTRRPLEVRLSPLDVVEDVVEERHIDVAPGQFRIREFAQHSLNVLHPAVHGFLIDHGQEARVHLYRQHRAGGPHSSRERHREHTGPSTHIRNQISWLEPHPGDHLVDLETPEPSSALQSDGPLFRGTPAEL